MLVHKDYINNTTENYHTHNYLENITSVTAKVSTVHAATKYYTFRNWNTSMLVCSISNLA